MTRWLCTLALVLAASAPAAAQMADRAPDPKACAPGERLQPGDGTTGQDATPRGENLSDKLARTDGVICPPGSMDTEMQIPAPDQGRMRVIPPPGGPGGDRAVQPK
jgi:hypothetical protein